MYSIVYPVSQPVMYPIGSGYSYIPNGLKFPPAKDKILAWHPGNIAVEYEPDYWLDSEGGYLLDSEGNRMFATLDYTKGSWWRKDYAKALGDFPLLITHSHCARFDGAERIHIETVNLVGDFTISFGCHLANAGSSFTVLGDWDSTSDVILFDDTSTGYVRVKIDNIDYLFTDIPLDDTRYSIVREGLYVTVSSNTATQTLLCSAGNVTISSIGSTSTFAYWRGEIWDVKMSCDTCSVNYPLAEGSGSTVYSTTGQSGAIDSSDLTAFWGTYQDNYYFNISNGYWDNGDNVKYPSDPGSAVFMSSNTWNETENLYSFGVVSEAAPALINTQEQLEGRLFTDASGNNIAVSQADIEAYIVGKEANFFCEWRGKGHVKYNEILAGQELADAQDFFGCL